MVSLNDRSLRFVYFEGIFDMLNGSIFMFVYCAIEQNTIDAEIAFIVTITWHVIFCFL